MEIWDIYDKNRNLTNQTVKRGAPMKPDEYHLVVHVWIINCQKEFLISKRTPNKPFPHMWECTAGSAISGDTSLTAAIREVKEEIGLLLQDDEGHLFFTERVDNTPFPHFIDVWIFKSTIDISLLKFQEDEVCDARWAKEAEINTLIEAGECMNHYRYLHQLFDYIHSHDTI